MDGGFTGGSRAATGEASIGTGADILRKQLGCTHNAQASVLAHGCGCALANSRPRVSDCVCMQICPKASTSPW